MSQPPIDLRSDVVAPPTEEMRDAMRAAQIGAYRDDEDPIVTELERRCADHFGKDAGLFVPSVSIANLFACLTACRAGESILADAGAYVHRHQAGALARLGGVVTAVVPLIGAVEAIAGAIADRPASSVPRVRLLWVENTHNTAGGAIVTPAELAALRSVLEGSEVAIHVDGARIFNAAVALGVPAAALAADIHSMSVGFTKGLACPSGCVLVGSRAFIEQARPLRCSLGVPQRKGGATAAACLVALETMVDRLAEDHATAWGLGQLIDEIPGLALEAPVVTNIVRFDTSRLGPAGSVVAALAERGVLTCAVGTDVVRAVTHRGIAPSDLDHMGAALRWISRELLAVPTGAPA